ncbi:MAG: hypothetical protein K2P33_07810 [Acutalibacter sp.]|nr:hypothetical protein [Acutalibacter sp.]
MKKNTVRFWVLFAVVVALYHVAAFAIPFAKSSVFFISYLFTLVAILSQIYVVKTAANRGRDVRSRFYGFPIIKTGMAYLGSQLALGFFLMQVGTIVPVWAAVVLCAMLFGCAAVGFISADAVRDGVEYQDVKLQSDITFIRDLQAKTASFDTSGLQSEAAHQVKKLAEAVRYSDPVSSAATQGVEGVLSACIDELQQMIWERNHSQVVELARNALQLLNQRNQICKGSKR